MSAYIETTVEVAEKYYPVVVEEDADDSGPYTRVYVTEPDDSTIPYEQRAAVMDAVREQVFDGDQKLLLSFDF